MVYLNYTEVSETSLNCLGCPHHNNSSLFFNHREVLCFLSNPSSSQGKKKAEHLENKPEKWNICVTDILKFLLCSLNPIMIP